MQVSHSASQRLRFLQHHHVSTRGTYHDVFLSMTWHFCYFDYDRHWYRGLKLEAFRKVPGPFFKGHQSAVTFIVVVHLARKSVYCSSSQQWMSFPWLKRDSSVSEID